MRATRPRPLLWNPFVYLDLRLATKVRACSGTESHRPPLSWREKEWQKFKRAKYSRIAPRVSPQHWGDLANIFPSHSVSCAKAGADTPRFVPSAPRLRRCTAAAPRAPDPPTATRLRWRPRPRGSHTPRCAGANRRTSALNPTRVWRPTAFAKGLARPCGRIRFSTAPPCHDSATRHRYAIAGTIIERIGPYAGLLHRPAAHIGALEPRTGAPARRPSSECTAAIPHRSKKAAMAVVAQR